MNDVAKEIHKGMTHGDGKDFPSFNGVFAAISVKNSKVLGVKSKPEKDF